MNSMGDFLCGIFMTIYWIFRLIVTALSYLQIEFPFTSMNTNSEILLLFLTLICIICVFKRVTIGGLIYFVAYCAYFGTDLYKTMQAGVNLNAIVDFFAIILATMVLLNIILGKTMKISNKKDTDWFYKGKNYDRELDERADKNNYKIY